MTAAFELFHEVSDPASALVRMLIVEQGLADAVRFRNVGYDEAREALTAHGGSEVPALWNGATLLVGSEAINAHLMAWVRMRDDSK